MPKINVVTPITKLAMINGQLSLFNIANKKLNAPRQIQIKADVFIFI